MRKTTMVKKRIDSRQCPRCGQPLGNIFITIKYVSYCNRCGDIVAGRRSERGKLLATKTDDGKMHVFSGETEIRATRG